MSLWDVWFVTYGTYADVERDGDIKPARVAKLLTFDAARRMVQERGFGYCTKPSEVL